MAHCLADSLIINKLKFIAKDIRHRFFLWWVSGYNNGRKNEVLSEQKNKFSYGIGSSTKQSLLEFLKTGNEFV